MNIYHVICGAILKAFVVHGSDWRWRPDRDPFSIERLAMDCSALVAASMLIWLAHSMFKRVFEKDWFAVAAVSVPKEPITVDGLSQVSSVGAAKEGEHWCKFDAYSKEHIYAASMLAMTILLWFAVLLAPKVHQETVMGFAGLVLLFGGTFVAHELTHWLLAKYFAVKTKAELSLGIGCFVIRLSGRTTILRLKVLQCAPFVLLTLTPLALAQVISEPVSVYYFLAIAGFNALISATDLVSFCYTVFASRGQSHVLFHSSGWTFSR